MLRDNFAQDALEQQIEGDDEQSLPNPSIERKLHNLSDMKGTSIFNCSMTLYTQKNSQIHVEVFVLRIFCEAFGINLKEKQVNTSSFDNIELPCLRIESVLIERRQFLDFILQGYCEDNGISDMQTVMDLQHIAKLTGKISAAIEYEIWYNANSTYSLRNSSVTSLFDYKLNKDFFKQQDITSASQMAQKTLQVLGEIEEAIQNGKYFRYSQAEVAIADILIFAAVEAVNHNVPQSQMANDITENFRSILELHRRLSVMRRSFPVKQIAAVASGANAGIPSDAKEINQSGVISKTRKQQIISASVIGAFTLLHLLRGFFES